MSCKMAGIYLLILFAAATLAVAVPSHSTIIRHSCGTHLSSDAIDAAEAYFSARRVAPEANASAFTAKIPVYWHVIRAGKHFHQGNIPKSQIMDSIAMLNQDYAPVKLTFTLVKYERTTNLSWFTEVKHGDTVEVAMKKALHKGRANALNIYTVGLIKDDANDPGRAGYAIYPSSYSANPKDDGVVMLYSAAPGSPLGKVLSHEVGHWAGLYHTFEGGCSGPGDYVDDTPPEASPSHDCLITHDTCPGGGVDSVHNIMNYAGSSCMTDLTPGQIERIKDQLGVYRGISVTG